MEPRRIIRTLITLMLLLGLVFTLSACGGITDTDALHEDAEQIEETVTEEPAAGEEPASQPAEQEGSDTDAGEAGDEGESAAEGDEGEGAGEGEEGGDTDAGEAGEEGSEGEGEGAGEGAGEAAGDPEDVEITYGDEPTINGVVVTPNDALDIDLDGAVLRGDFSGFDFRNRDFSNPTLAGAKFDGAQFNGAKFSGVTFWYGSFVGADFTGARMMGADLSNAIFSSAIFTDAVMPGNSFKYLYAAFDGATWVDGVQVCAADSLGDCN